MNMQNPVHFTVLTGHTPSEPDKASLKLTDASQNDRTKNNLRNRITIFHYSNRIRSIQRECP